MERHRLDALSLIFGLLFVAIAMVGLTDVFTLTAADLRWLGPALLVVVGIALLFTAGGGRKEAPDGRDDRADDAVRSDDGSGRPTTE